MLALLFKIVVLSCLTMVETLELTDVRMQFLDFASDAESEYYSRISSGNYSVLKARNDYTRLEKIRFAESENVSEIFEELQIVSEMDCIEWQRTGELPIGFVPTLIGARGENNRYGFSLLKDGAGNGFGTISRLEMFPEESIEKNESPSIYEPFMIGKGGSIVQLVKLGHLKVEDWRYDSKSELWFGRFQVNESNQEWHVYFDPDRRWIRRTTLLIDQLPIFSKTLDYDDQNIRVIRVYRPNLSDPSDEGSSLLESWFFSSVRNERVDPNSLLISHYGHQEPFDDAPKNRLSYYWYLLPLFGIFLVLLARWIRRGSNVEY